MDPAEFGARLRSRRSASSAAACRRADRARRFPAACRRCCTPRATAGSSRAHAAGARAPTSNERDANGITPLLIAITNNHPDVARFLIDHGADIKAVDWYGRTPLWAAVETRNMDVDNATFVNSIDRAPFLELIQDAARRAAPTSTSA